MRSQVMMLRIGKIMELFWLGVMLVTAPMAGYAIWTVGFNEGWQWLLLPAIATAMWMFRRFTRRRMQAWAARQSDPRNQGSDLS
mgnify:FL=1